MNRFIPASLTPTQQPVYIEDETELSLETSVDIYDGDHKSTYTYGILRLTTHRLLWVDEDNVRQRRSIALPLSSVARVEVEGGSFFKGPSKCSLQLMAVNAALPALVASKENHVVLKLHDGDVEKFVEKVKRTLQNEAWKKAAKKAEPAEFSTKHAGVGGVMRTMQKKNEDTDKEMGAAFTDLTALAAEAKNMVALAEKFAAKVRSKEGVSEGESSEFNKYLLSMGIANPVTKKTYGEGQLYHRELARQLADFLVTPLKKVGGMMLAVDAYCMYNVARAGASLISPDDLLTACSMFTELSLPLSLRSFDSSGVVVVQLNTLSDEAVAADMVRMLREGADATGATADDAWRSVSAAQVARAKNISAILAREHLLTAERQGALCRDDTVEGLKFFLNAFADEA